MGAVTLAGDKSPCNGSGDATISYICLYNTVYLGRNLPLNRIEKPKKKSNRIKKLVKKYQIEKLAIRLNIEIKSLEK